MNHGHRDSCDARAVDAFDPGSGAQQNAEEDRRRIARALGWIVDVLRRYRVPYQAVGGLAARAHGARRPLLDIDLYVPFNEAAGVLEEVRPFVVWGPEHHAGDEWDLTPKDRLPRAADRARGFLDRPPLFQPHLRPLGGAADRLREVRRRAGVRGRGRRYAKRGVDPLQAPPRTGGGDDRPRALDRRRFLRPRSNDSARGRYRPRRGVARGFPSPGSPRRSPRSGASLGPSGPPSRPG